MPNKTYKSIGFQLQEDVAGPRHLLFGPIVPDGQTWGLKLIAGKLNAGLGRADELVVCVFLPPQPTDHPKPPPGTWVLLAGKANVTQFEVVKWEGLLFLPAGARLGLWVRGGFGYERDVVELNAIYDVTILPG